MKIKFREIFFMSNDVELYLVFRRFFLERGAKSVEKDKMPKSKDALLLNLDFWNQEDFSLWSRVRKKYLNPLVILGVEEEKQFIVENPVFEAYPYHHLYQSIPFEVDDLFNKIKVLEPVYDDITRKNIYENYSNKYENYLITHQFRVEAGKKGDTVKKIERIMDHYKGKDNDIMVAHIEKCVRQMNEHSDWENIAIQLKEFLGKSLEGDHGN